MENPRSGIYEIRCAPTGERYIGSAINIRRRFSCHRYRLAHRTHCNVRLQDAWDIHGEAAFEFSILAALYPPIASGRLTQLEQEAIDLFKPEFNLRRVGADFTDEQRAKLSASHMGHSVLPETRAKLSTAMIGNQRRLGYHIPPEVRLKMSAVQKGRPFSAEHLANITASNKARVFTADMRARMSAASKGRPAWNKGIRPSAESVEKMASALRGRKLSEEHCARITAASRARRHTPETRARMSVIHKARWAEKKRTT